jgi:hypothetical protein
MPEPIASDHRSTGASPVVAEREENVKRSGGLRTCVCAASGERAHVCTCVYMSAVAVATTPVCGVCNWRSGSVLRILAWTERLWRSNCLWITCASVAHHRRVRPIVLLAVFFRNPC